MEKNVESAAKTPESEKNPQLKRFVFHVRYPVLRTGYPRIQLVKERECWVFHYTKEEAVQALTLASPDFVSVMKKYPERSTCEIFELTEDEVIGVPQDGGGRNRHGPGSLLSFLVKEIESWQYYDGQEERLENSLKMNNKV
ncbi:MAG: hypothetical protein G01um101419_167 [Parcubacteria group bacterium Gr01-1014_19]|nr:MAG: hypothetical protein G01um101419_167 [Parcubacteria group bacterium Gr01-1014_19]